LKIVREILDRWLGQDSPFIVGANGSLYVREVLERKPSNLKPIQRGEVVALVGDFDSTSISILLYLVDLGAIVVPLTEDTAPDHEYFFETALVDWVIKGGQLTHRQHARTHSLLDQLRHRGNPGLVLFTSGTTGRPKAILHDLSQFLARYRTPRPMHRTLSFLLFDHIGGINTMFHTIFNRGTIVVSPSRSVNDVLRTIDSFQVEVLPSTPTFLRMLLLSEHISSRIPESLKLITYGTERMDLATLKSLCERLPKVDFRQTYGMSELGILRVKSMARDSLFMKIGGEGVQVRVVDGILEIQSESRMLGYLNAPSPFSENGWYRTGDVVEKLDDYVRVTGRINDVINVGGLKFMASDVEQRILALPMVEFVKVTANENPITGQHVEAEIQVNHRSSISESDLRAMLVSRLPKHMVPRRIRFGELEVSHRFKRL